MEFEFSGQILKNSQVQVFTKICPVEAELFHADGETDVLKVIAGFRNFVKQPKNSILHVLYCRLTYLKAALQIRSCKGPVKYIGFKKSNADLYACISFL